MRKVMVRAWEIAKGAAAKHGGKAIEYIAAALKMAWAEVKGVVTKVVKKVAYVELGLSSNKYKSWVAEIKGLHNRFKLDRVFVSKNDAVGCEEYSLYAGKYYEVCNRGDRYFAKVVDGEVVEVNEDEVIANFA